MAQQKNRRKLLSKRQRKKQQQSSVQNAREMKKIALQKKRETKKPSAFGRITDINNENLSKTLLKHHFICPFSCEREKQESQLFWYCVKKVKMKRSGVEYDFEEVLPHVLQTNAAAYVPRNEVGIISLSAFQCATYCSRGFIHGKDYHCMTVLILKEGANIQPIIFDPNGHSESNPNNNSVRRRFKKNFRFSKDFKFNHTGFDHANICSLINFTFVEQLFKLEYADMKKVLQMKGRPFDVFLVNNVIEDIRNNYDVPVPTLLKNDRHYGTKSKHKGNK
eukprot:TRINITY_DN302996_c0_g1_i2.p1 TRINITY_DN302996_c0_g1~~TRINITY_DN302996_c0_g1_i2.p1  ORF type:complete len:278 (-),score=29.08 TRINITY_DN302996_c0_g1_i2:47-880(-)